MFTDISLSTSVYMNPTLIWISMATFITIAAKFQFNWHTHTPWALRKTWLIKKCICLHWSLGTWFSHGVTISSTRWSSPLELPTGTYKFIIIYIQLKNMKLNNCIYHVQFRKSDFCLLLDIYSTCKPNITNNLWLSLRKLSM